MKIQLVEKLKKLRGDARVTQGQLEKYAGIPQSTLSDLENGRFAHKTLEALSRLATYYGVSTDYLLGLIDEPQSSAAHTNDPATKELLDLIQQMNAPQRNQLAGIAKVLIGASRIIE